MFINLGKNKFILVMIILFLIFVLYFFVHYNIKNKIIYYKDLIDQKSSLIKTAENYKNNYKKINQKIYKKSFEKEYPLNIIHHLLLKKNIKIKELKPIYNENNVEVSLSLSGDFKKISSFLLEVNKLNNLSRLHSLEIKKDINSNFINLDMKLCFSLKGIFFEKINISRKTNKKNFRNPFIKICYGPYKIKHKENNIEFQLPLALKGIIGSKERRLAIIDINKNIKIVDDEFKCNKVLIKKILTNKIIIEYKNIDFILEIGSDKGVRL